MGKLFGTDGVRGIANRELTPELAFNLGRAGSFLLGQKEQGDGSAVRIMVGKDTRLSGDMLEAALAAGICSTGADVLSLGVIPTPGVAYLAQKHAAACGIVISASHNPVQDNGIKFFGPNGYKLPDDVEEEIEKLVLRGTANLPRPQGAGVGRIYDCKAYIDEYLDFLLTCYSGEEKMQGLKVVVDCANGAAYELGPKMWEKLGATVIAINDQPDGCNINKNCGSTSIKGLSEAVVENKADLGLAYDGDADRCIAVDEKGQEIDGDYIMAICALDLMRQGKLTPPRVVATVMSNIGLDIALQKLAIQVENCPVGDRYVLEKIQETGAILGGEQSGHIIFPRYATTGDGLLTSLKLVEVLRRTGMKLSELAGQMEKYPQLLVNIRMENKNSVLSHKAVKRAVAQAEEKLGEWGKLVVRPSGTEPLVRIMAQGPAMELLEEVIGEIKDAINLVQG